MYLYLIKVECQSNDVAIVQEAIDQLQHCQQISLYYSLLYAALFYI